MQKRNPALAVFDEYQSILRSLDAGKQVQDAPPTIQQPPPGRDKLRWTEIYSRREKTFVLGWDSGTAYIANLTTLQAVLEKQIEAFGETPAVLEAVSLIAEYADKDVYIENRAGPVSRPAGNRGSERRTGFWSGVDLD